MTIEEKAKAYDEALEKARNKYYSKYHPSKGPSGVYLNNADLEEIFPVLKESEDERIRKALIEVAREVAQKQFFINRGTTLEDVIAYLEKQKEQKFTEKQDYSDLTDLERAIHRGFLVVGVENVPVTIIKETAQDCLAWMKPAEWSEEDNIMLGNIILCLREYCLTDEINWLKSLPLNLKKKNEDVSKLCSNEWSEEDEKILGFIIEDIVDQINDPSTDEGERQLFDKEIKLLKSIRPQPHWKPSEEQMLALGGVLDYLDESDNEDADIVRKLINDLKKL